MQDRELRIGGVPITAQVLLYTMFTISVISSAIVNTLPWATQSRSFLEILIVGLVSLLVAIGFIAIILEVTKRWYFIGGILFLAIGLFALISIIFNYIENIGPFNDPYTLVLGLLVYISTTLAGLIIILRGKSFLSVKGS